MHHHHEGHSAYSWFELIALPTTLLMGWAAQFYQFYRDRGLKRLFMASFGLLLLTVKTVLPYMQPAMGAGEPGAVQRFVTQYSISISLVGSALLIGSSFMRPPQPPSSTPGTFAF